MNSSEQPPLDISVVAGGTIGTRAWMESIRAIVRRLVSIRSEYSTPLSLQVVFQIPGAVLRPDFSGVRTGTFSRRERRLVVQVAVPEQLQGDRQAWVIGMLKEAVSQAEEFAVMEALADTELSNLRKLIDALSVAPP